MTRRRGRLAAVAAAGLIAAGTYAGCASSNGDGETSTATTPAAQTTARLSGPPLRIYAVAPVRSPLADNPMIWSGAKAAARAINERGGIAGREVEVVECNGRGDPNEEVACARAAVADRAVAVVGSLVQVNAQGFTDTLAEGRVANVAPIATTPLEWSAPINFPVDAAGLSYVACGALGTEAADASKLATVGLNLAISQGAQRLIESGARAAAVDYAGTYTFPPTQADLAPVVQEVSGTGAEAVAMAVSPQILVQFIGAASAQGKDWSYCTTEGVVSGKELKAIGARNLNVASGLPPISQADSNETLQRFVEEMKAQEETGDEAASTSPEDYKEAALRAWLGVQVVEDVARGIDGPITNESFLAAIERATVDTGVVPPLDFARPQPEAGFERIFNPMVMLATWNPETMQSEAIEGLEPFNALDAVR